jgi:tetratricopeptide (TPR) repeat protein
MELLMPFSSHLISVLRLLKRKVVEALSQASGLSVKQIGSILRGKVKNTPSADLERLLTAMGCSRAEVVVMSSCLETLAGLDRWWADPDEAAAQERYIAAAGRHLRARLRAPGLAVPSPYPAPYEVELDRLEAREAWARICGEAKTPAEMTIVLRAAPEYHRWAFVELLCDESERAASQDAGRARDLAVLAVRAALRLPAWEPWRRCVLGYAVAHLANALRVAGRLDVADRRMAAARRLHASGLDPNRLLDPGRLFDLEASLRRAQRRFAESLDLLEKAAPLTRRPEHVSLKAAFTLEVMGEYQRAIQILTELEPRVRKHPERRLKSIQRFNLAVCLSHVGRHRRAASLMPVLRRLVNGDELDKIRLRWLEGRIAAGLGETGEALAALAEARDGFAQHKLWYDVALSLVETAAIHLERGELAEAARISAELAPLFQESGIHEEARKALRIFAEAAERQAATAELARLVLAWLFRAQHDRGLAFDPPPDTP